jgi:hypothetical protein
MKSNCKYSEISSFEDFRTEKERLRMKSMIIEAKMELTFMRVKRLFSVSNLLISVAREVVLPKFSDLLSVLTKKAAKEATEEKGEN